MPSFTGWFQGLKADTFQPELGTPVSESLGSASVNTQIRIAIFSKLTCSNQQFLQLKNAADVGLPDAGLLEVEVGLPSRQAIANKK